jgi:hypothetical protein
MGMVSVLRRYVHAKHNAAKSDRLQEAEAYTAQIQSIEQRAELIRRCFLQSSFLWLGQSHPVLLGLGLYWKNAAVAAVFVLALICLLAGVFYYRSNVSAERGSQRSARFPFHRPWAQRPRRVCTNRFR